MVQPVGGLVQEEEVLGATTLLLTSLAAITEYQFSVAAATSAGTGPFTEHVYATTPEGGMQYMLFACCCRDLCSLVTVPQAAPQVGMVQRVSATTLMVSWSPLSLQESRGNVLQYHVRYRPLDRPVRRNLDDGATIVNSSSSEVVITDLDPRLTYAVALAASTAAGMGAFSTETVAECT